MRGLLFTFVSLALSLPSIVLAQTNVFPPDGARVIAGPQGVTLQWPGPTKGRYLLGIYTGQVVILEQEVTGSSYTLPVRAGLRYQWKVSTATNGLYRELLPSKSFLVSVENQVVALGSTGGAGKPGTSRTHLDGLPGGNGGPGPQLTATLQPDGPYVRLLITGMPAQRTYYFAPGSPPLWLRARGGPGGPGGPGGQGQDGYANYTTGLLIPAEPGGHGGAGGQGGPGGLITVISSGLPVESYLRFDVEGGRGGSGGRPGQGGRGVVLTAPWHGAIPPGYGYGTAPAPGGTQGPDGEPGPSGQVIIR